MLLTVGCCPVARNQPGLILYIFLNIISCIHLYFQTNSKSINSVSKVNALVVFTYEQSGLAPILDFYNSHH